MISLYALMVDCYHLFDDLESLGLSDATMAEVRLGIVKSIARGLVRDNKPFVMDYNPYRHCNEKYNLNI